MQSLNLKNIGLAILGLFALLFLWGTFFIVGPADRAVKVRMGEVSDQVYTPGPHLKIPLIEAARKYSLAPTTDDMVVDIEQGGAVSSDNQIIGAGSKIVWTYDGARIMDIVKKYPDTSQLSKIVTNTVYEALKAEIGKYTIFELAKNAGKISSDTKTAAAKKLADYPIILTQFNLTNWDWSADFDKRINDTIAAQQEVEKARANANREEQIQRQQTIKAEATARSLVAQATGEKDAAVLRAEARRAEGQGENDYNKLMSQNMDIEVKLRQLNIELERARRWNGAQVSQYIPITAAGAIVTIPDSK